MSIEIDETMQAEVEDDAANEETGEMEYLTELEGVDRQLQATETEKSDAMKVFNKHIKDLKKKRGALLMDIEAYRLGERGLFDGE